MIAPRQHKSLEQHDFNPRRDTVRQKFSCARVNKAQLRIRILNIQEPQTSFFVSFLSSLILVVQFASALNL